MTFYGLAPALTADLGVLSAFKSVSVTPGRDIRGFPLRVTRYGLRVTDTVRGLQLYAIDRCARGGTARERDTLCQSFF